MKLCIYLLLQTLWLLSFINPTLSQSKRTGNDSNPKTNNPVTTAQVVNQVDGFLTNAESLGYSGVILWAKNDKVILKKGYGLADRSTGIRMSPKTVVDMGSVTKMFTAAAILKLEEQGKLSVNDSIARFLESVPNDKTEITIHQLLSHTSGLPSDTIVPRPLDATAVDYALIGRDDFVERVLRSDLISRPGQKFLYSNDGYGLLAVIVEKVSGMAYEAYLNKEIFTPAQMKKTGYIIPRWNNMQIARGYIGNKEQPTPLEYPWLKDGPGWNLRGNGGLLTTTEDLYQWHQALNGENVLSKESKEKMFTPYSPTDQERKNMYGYGWYITTTENGKPEIYHSGGNGKFAVYVRRFPKDNSVIIEVTNYSSGPAYGIVRNLHNWIFDKKLPKIPGPPVKITEARLQKFAGTYELSSGKRFDIKYQNKRLTVAGDAPGISSAIAFPYKLGKKELAEYESMAIRVIEGLAKQNFQPLFSVLWRDTKREEEEAYWREQWKTWESQYGKYITSKVIGARSEKDTLDIYVTIQFQQGKQTIVFQRNTDGLFYVNVSSKTARIVPGFYWLSPTSLSELTAYNFELNKSVVLKFYSSGKRSGSGLDIVGANSKEFAKKIN